MARRRRRRHKRRRPTSASRIEDYPRLVQYMQGVVRCVRLGRYKEAVMGVSLMHAALHRLGGARDMLGNKAYAALSLEEQQLFDSFLHKLAINKSSVPNPRA